MEQVKLLGNWPSIYSYRVVWALELKGVQYQFVNEDLANKSDELEHYNPIYKRIPVLIHNKKPVLESSVILEYIDEVWPQKPLLSSDPHERAVARFWTRFAEDKTKVFYNFIQASGEELEKAVKESKEVFKIMEEMALGDKRFFGGNELGIADLAFGWMAWWLEPMEVATGVKLLDTNSFPQLSAWVNEFRAVPKICANLPDKEQLFAYIKSLREKLIA